MAAGFAEIALALAKLPIFCGRFQTATHRNLYQSVIQWRHCCRSMKKRVLLPRALPREKGQRARRGSGGWHQQREGGDVLFLLAKMCQDSVDNVLIFNTRNDPDRTTAAAANLNVYVEDALEPLCPGHCRMSLSG